MFLAVVGAILYLAAAFVLPTNPNYPAAQFKGLMRAGGIGLIVVGLLMSSIKQIEAGEVGVQKLFGKVENEVLPSGLHIVNPLVNIIPLSVRTQNYTMSGVHDEGKVKGDDAIRVLTNDGLELVIDLTILYHINQTEAPRIVQSIGADYEDVIVRPVTRTKIRDNSVYYTAIDLYSGKRDEFQGRIFHDIDSLFKMRGLVLEQVLLRNITLPTSVKQTIESKINAEQDAQKMTYVLQKEKQEADRKRVEAQGIADYQKILSTGLSDKLLQYESIKAQKEMALSANSKIIIMNGKASPIILGNQ